jgi:hypothetical protein
MMQWLRKRSLPARVLVYAVAAALAFALAAGVGTMGALVLRGDLVLFGGEAPRSLDEQGNAAQPQDKDAAQQKGTEQKDVEQKDAAKQEEVAPQPEQGKVASQPNEAFYLSKVGEIQGNAVEISLNSHNKLLRYDVLTTDNLEELQANEAALQELAGQVENLGPPQEYADQYEVFRSAINELHVAAQLAFELVDDPTTATKAKFDAYDRHVANADSRLRESNESLGRDYETIGDVQEISPL